ncbi:type II secretion system protein GspC [Polycyclovorans algicola]|uniref:type II secretion system protein GspC n=1 Tax=Polycyclovorans algicola TaxID=616992 RepID=UPI0004A6BF5C|nr:type II secretion system protein GspC [Polycyclovorans algicola]
MSSLHTLSLAWPRQLAAGWPRVQRWLIPGSILLFAALIGWQLAGLFWHAVGTETVWQPPRISATGDSSQPSAQIDLGAISEAKLFGTAEANLATKAVTDAPETTLNLKLIGLLFGRTPEGSRALINTGGSNEAPFSTGMEVVRGVTLEQIFADRVILMRQGRPETLRLEKDAPAANVAAAPAASDLGDAVVLPQLGSVRDEILQDPSKAATYLRVQPSASGGSMQGYRIYPGRDRALFNAAGLKPGDLVTAINGTELNDASKALSMLTDLSTASSVSLTIERGGNSQNVTISLD